MLTEHQTTYALYSATCYESKQVVIATKSQFSDVRWCVSHFFRKLLMLASMASISQYGQYSRANFPAADS
ncbi:hypothetical protein J6590_071806, partial [Homalodisca vitripennis]